MFVVIFVQNENDAIVNIDILFELMLLHFDFAMHSFRVKNVLINLFFKFTDILNDQHKNASQKTKNQNE